MIKDDEIQQADCYVHQFSGAWEMLFFLAGFGIIIIRDRILQGKLSRKKP